MRICLRRLPVVLLSSAFSKMPLKSEAPRLQASLSDIPFQTPVLVPSKFLHFVGHNSANSKLKTSKHEAGWIALDDSKDIIPETAATSKLTEFSVVQWNVWFDGEWLSSRSEKILEHILSLKPSIVALQEVTLMLWGIFLSHPQIRMDYIITNYRQQITETGSFYGVMVLINKELAKACGGKLETWEVKSGKHGMKSRMGRVIVGVDLGELNIRFATAHFESPPSPPASRIHQFKLSSLLPTVPSTLFPQPSLTMVCGDTNCVTPNELPHAFSTEANSAWRDAFEQVRPGEDGYTYTLTYPNRYRLARLDRMTYYPVDGEWKVRECETFGSDIEVERKEIFSGVWIEDQRGRDGKVWVSDHEGLRTVFGRGKMT